MKRTGPIFALGLSVWIATSAHAEAPPAPLQDSASWDAMRYDIVGDATPAPAAGLFVLETPYRAEDAATVPLHLRQSDPLRPVERATIVIDENPAPVAAEFTFAEAMMPVDMELRVRVDQYSNVRAIVESGGQTFMDGGFVKASGGCSAPATRTGEDALADLGRMRLRDFGAAQDTERREAQIMIRHPNYSGLQRNQITHLFIPAHFIDHIEVRQGDDLLFTMQGGISISENPVFRFAYRDNGAPSLSVIATDTEGNRFAHELPKGVGS